MQLFAAARLRATEGQPDEVEAQFDQDREHHLKQIQDALYKSRLVYVLSKHHLYHKTNDGDAASEIKETLKILTTLGHKFRIVQGVLQKPRFAVKAQDGLTFQRIDDGLRLFFYVP